MKGKGRKQDWAKRTLRRGSRHDKLLATPTGSYSEQGLRHWAEIPRPRLHHIPQASAGSHPGKKYTLNYHPHARALAGRYPKMVMTRAQQLRPTPKERPVATTGHSLRSWAVRPSLKGDLCRVLSSLSQPPRYCLRGNV